MDPQDSLLHLYKKTPVYTHEQFISFFVQNKGIHFHLLDVYGIDGLEESYDGHDYTTIDNREYTEYALANAFESDGVVSIYLKNNDLHEIYQVLLQCSKIDTLRIHR